MRRSTPCADDTARRITRQLATGVLPISGLALSTLGDGPRTRGLASCNTRTWRHSVSIGESLADARRQAGLTVSQVSQQTRIRESIIRDIEQDDFSACGGDFYARGHIRSIAAVGRRRPGPADQRVRRRARPARGDQGRRGVRAVHAGQDPRAALAQPEHDRGPGAAGHHRVRHVPPGVARRRPEPQGQGGRRPVDAHGPRPARSPPRTRRPAHAARRTTW